MMVGVIAGLTQPVDPRVLATEPLTERQLGLGVLAGVRAGPPGISAALVGIGAFAGAVRGPASIVPVALAVVAFLITLLLVSRTTVNALGLLSVRLPRAGQLVVGIGSLVFYAGFQIVPRMIGDVGSDDQADLAVALRMTPMGQLGKALGIAGDQPLAALGHVALGSLWLVPLALVFTWSTRRLLVSTTRRHPTRSERTYPSAQRTGTTVVRVGSGRAVAWRSVLVRLRTPRTALETFTGAGVGLAIVLVPALTVDDVGAGAVLVGGAVQLAVLFIAGDASGPTGRQPPARSSPASTPGYSSEPRRARSIVVAAPIAMVGPLIAAGVGRRVELSAGRRARRHRRAVRRSRRRHGAVDPRADRHSGQRQSARHRRLQQGLVRRLALALVMAALAVVTLPVALALFWAVRQQSLPLVTRVRSPPSAPAPP